MGPAYLGVPLPLKIRAHRAAETRTAACAQADDNECERRMTNRSAWLRPALFDRIEPFDRTRPDGLLQRRAAGALLLRGDTPQVRDVLGRLVRRQIGLGDLLGLLQAALQPDHQREVLAHALVAAAARGGAPQRRLG